MVYGLAQSSIMWMLAFCCGWTCYPSALPSHLINDWALQTQQRPQRMFPFIMGLFSFFFLTQIISIGWGKTKGLCVKAQLECSHTPWICLAGRQDQTGIRKASGRYAEGTKSNYSDSDFHISKPLDYTCHHSGTGVAERNGEAHWDDIMVL